MKQIINKKRFVFKGLIQFLNKERRFFLLLFFYPWLLLVGFGWFEIPFFKWYIKEVIGFGIFTSLLMLLLGVFKSKTINRFFMIVFLALLAVLVVVKLSFYHHYQVKLSASAWFVILETHSNEAMDFLKNYFDAFTIVLGLLALIPLYVLSHKYFRNRVFRVLPESKNPLVQVLILLVVVLFGFAIHYKFKQENIIVMSLDSYKTYKAIKLRFKSEMAQSESKFINVVSAADTTQTYVVVIGESTSSWHMQLYGYPRETNPELHKIRNELVVFENAIVPNVHTVNSLEKILTFSDYENPNKVNNASIVQLANEAGFETYWLSSQRPIGIHESLAATIARASDHKVYTNTEDYNNQILDESLLPELDKALNDSHNKKLIFIHLIGTHIPYGKRFPKHFEYFKKTDDVVSTYASLQGKHIINDYDNAIRYNDFILKSIIDKVKSKCNISYVAYFSDHGDEVYDTMDFLGHNEYHATGPMYEVPFLVWFSPSYQDTFNSFKNEAISQRLYNLEDFIHSFSQISQINFEGFQAEKSIFNTNFIRKKRWIKQDVDYDNR